METQIFEHATVGADAFEEIYQSYKHFVAQRISRMLGPGYSAQVEDMVQDTFLKAFRSLQKGKILHSSAISSWLNRIATNLALDTFRKQGHTTLVSFTAANMSYGKQDVDLVDEIGWSVGSEESFEQRLATRECIERVLHKMPQASTACLWHYEYYGFSCAEIAEQLHMNTTTVRVRLTRARTCFKKLYQHEKED
jgi:RNA polymerase sigma-70 factor (ECF subfamily)